MIQVLTTENHPKSVQNLDPQSFFWFLLRICRNGLYIPPSFRIHHKLQPLTPDRSDFIKFTPSIEVHLSTPFNSILRRRYLFFPQVFSGIHRVSANLWMIRLSVPRATVPQRGLLVRPQRALVTIQVFYPALILDFAWIWTGDLLLVVKPACFDRDAVNRGGWGHHRDDVLSDCKSTI